MENPKKARKGAIICAGVLLALIAAVLLAYVGIVVSEAMAIGGVIVIIAIYILLLLAVIVGIVVSLRQRLAELGSEEYEESKKY